MSPECLTSGYQRKYSTENFTRGGQKKRYNDTLKASLKDFNIQPETWEQAAQDCAKRHSLNSLNREGTDDYEAKRVCKAEQKRKERQARAKGSSSATSSSELTCSICNRQLTKVGLSSHQRTHQRTWTVRLSWSFSLVRDEHQNA